MTAAPHKPKATRRRLIRRFAKAACANCMGRSRRAQNKGTPLSR